jgi:membrane protein
MNKIPKNFQPAYRRLNQSSGGLLDVLVRAFERFDQNRGSEAAASISYYTIFSIFPLLIFTVTAVSYFINPATALQLFTSISNVLPIPLETVVQQVERLNQSRGIFNIIALVGFLWAASGVFNTLTLNLDRAWGRAERRSLIVRRLVAIGMVVGLVGVIMAAVIFVSLFDISMLSGLFPLVNLPAIQTLFPGLSRIIPSFIIRLLLIWLIYRLVPAARVKGWPAFWGALVVSLAWGITTAGFSWYLSSGFSKYDVIYGSLGAVIAFLTWIYLGAWILLIGAYLAEAIQYGQPVE